MDYFDDYDKETEYQDVPGRIIRETQAAILFNPFGDDKEIWIPKSQIEEQWSDDDGAIWISIPEWLADREGL